MLDTLSTTPRITAGTWRVDPEHTSLEFRVRHAGLARVRGVFRVFEGALVAREDGAVSAWASIDAASLETGVGARDDHLRSSDFFAVDEHPRIAFRTTAVESAGGERLRIAGELTIRGTTRTVELDGELLGTGRDEEGNLRVGLEAAGVLDRRDFGLTWNTAVDGGGLLVGNRVDLRLEVSALYQEA
jgi:polyisoprenoid-binding protein YceI